MPPLALAALANAASPPAIFVKKCMKPSTSEGAPDILSLNFPFGSNTSNAGIPRIPNFCIKAFPPGASALRCTLTKRGFVHKPILLLLINFSSFLHAGHHGAEISTNIKRLVLLASAAAAAISERQFMSAAYAHKNATWRRMTNEAERSVRMDCFMSSRFMSSRFMSPTEKRAQLLLTPTKH